MPFPDLELVRVRIEDLNRRAERERLVSQTLASRPRRERLRSALSFARSVFHRARTGVRLAAPTTRSRPNSNRSSGSPPSSGSIAPTVFGIQSAGSEDTLSRNISGKHSRELPASEYETRKGGLFLHRPRPHARGCASVDAYGTAWLSERRCAGAR